MSERLRIGTCVQLRDRFLDEAGTRPVVGRIEDVFVRPDWGGRLAYAVLFEHDDPRFPGGGEFGASWLRPIGDAAA